MKYLLLILLLSFSAYTAELNDYVFKIIDKCKIEDVEYNKSVGTSVSVNLEVFNHIGKHYLLTAAHCVKHKRVLDEEIPYVEFNGKHHKCLIKNIDVDFDIALLFCNDELPTYCSLADALTLKDNSKLDLLGFPLGENLLQIKGKLLEINDFWWKAKVSKFNRGFSGGPVFYKDKLFGIITAGYIDDSNNIVPEYALFLPLRRIFQFLKE